MIRSTCPNCSSVHQIDAKLLGRSFTCPDCGQLVRVATGKTKFNPTGRGISKETIPRTDVVPIVSKAESAPSVAKSVVEVKQSAGRRPRRPFDGRDVLLALAVLSLTTIGLIVLGSWISNLQSHSEVTKTALASPDPPELDNRLARGYLGERGFQVGQSVWVQVSFVTKDGGETIPSHVVSCYVSAGRVLKVSRPWTHQNVNGWRVYLGLGTPQPDRNGMHRYGDVIPFSSGSLVVDQEPDTQGSPPPVKPTAYYR